MSPARRSRPPGLSALVLSLQAAWGGLAWALPQGAQVVNGQVVMSQPAAGTLQVQASHGAIINWQKFSIGAGEIARFVQPGATSAVLNRVVGAEASQLLGQLQANGRVFLINPHGIVIGNGARIDTNSFIASTLNISDADFLAGRLKFMAGAQAAGISQAGYITAGPGGSVALIAPDITNTGIIHAPDGNILLAAGRRLEITSTDLTGVTFEIQAPTDAVLNLGHLLAENGAVRAFAASLRHSGVIRAERLVHDGDGSVVLAGREDVTLTAGSVTSASGVDGGQVLVQSEAGVARVAGQVSATGSQGQGGDVRVLGDRVALETGATLDASGQAGGGQVLVGGDFQGANAAVPNARRVHVAEGAALRADAVGQGDGGRVIVWADENTRFAGDVSARGGAAGGDGGFAEVSGKQQLVFTGTADLGAAAGALGTLLLDPLDIVVSSGSGILPVVVDEFADFPENVVTIAPEKLAALGANVTLQAERDVFVKDRITLTTAGAGLSITAGGAGFNAGGIVLEDLFGRPGGIATAGGAVTLRGSSVSGPGTITTGGGAVDILTTGALTYSSAINSGGGAVTLGSLNSSVSGANVNAGAGTIGVTGQTGVFSSTYATTGTLGLTATAGSISGVNLTAGAASLQATGSISASVNASDRVDAAGSSVSLQNTGSGALRLGNVSGTSSLSLTSGTGFARAAGGALASPFITINSLGSGASAGTAGAPLHVSSAATRVSATNLAAPVHLDFDAGTTVNGLWLQGTVAGVGGSTVTGSANLSSLSLGAGPGQVNLSATATGGLGDRLSVQVSDGGINTGTIDLQGGGGLYLEAAGPVSMGSVTTTRTSGYGIEVYAQQCDYWAYAACAASSPITATGALNAGTAGVWLQTLDNGDIAVAGAITAGSVYLQAGEVYYTSPSLPFPQQPTTNHIDLASVSTTGSFSAYLYGNGDIDIGSLSAGGYVDISAGTSYQTPAPSVFANTNNNIQIGSAEPVAANGGYWVGNYGIGEIAITGAIERAGDVWLQTFQGDVSTGDITSINQPVYAAANGGSLTVGDVSSGDPSSSGGVDLYASGDLTFGKIASSGFSSSWGHVTLTSESGAIRTAVDDDIADITATGSVTLSAVDATGGHIGNGSFDNPLDIQQTSGGAVTLTAGGNIGAAGKAVRIDMDDGTIDVTSTDGQFHVAATDAGDTVEKAVRTIRLSASAAGIGNGGTATFRSLHLDVDAASDGSAITIGDPGSGGDLSQAAGTLDEFRFTASGGSALGFADIALGTTGHNQLFLSAGNGLTQTGGNIAAGHMELAGGAGNVTVGDVTSASPDIGHRLVISGADITTGDLSAQSLSVTGANLDLGSVETTGTHRSSFVYVPRLDSNDWLIDDLVLTASGNIATSGNIVSATSAWVTAGGDITVDGGAGSVAVGTVISFGYTDTAQLQAGTSGTLSAGDVSGAWLNLSGHEVDVTDLTAAGSLTVMGTDLKTGDASAANISLTGTTFDTGNLTASGGLTIQSAAGYAPVGVDLTASSANITAQGNITIAAANRLTAGTVSLTTGSGSNGNVSAALRNTTTLTVNTDRGFAVDVEDSLLGSLNLTADSDKALVLGSAGAEVTAVNGPNQQSFVLDDTPTPTLTIGSTGTVGAWSINYNDTSTTALAGGLDVDVNYGASGQFNLQLASDTDVSVLASMSGGQYTLNTGGNVLLSDLSTNGGHINVTSRSGDITIDEVSTLAGTGGNVTLTALTGSIESVGSGISAAGTTSGNVTLSAAQGSVGGAGTVDLSGVNQLSITARDTVNVDVAGSLSGLSLTTAGSGSGGLSVVAASYPGLSIARSGGNLELGALTAANGLSLTATDGDIRVVGDVAVGSLNLAAQAGNLEIVASGGARSVSATGALQLSAGQDVVIAAGGTAGDTVAVQGASVNVQAVRDLLVSGAAASASLTGTTTATSVLNAGRDLKVSGGSGTGASAEVSVAGSSSSTIGRDLVVQAGSGGGTFARLHSAGNQSASVGRDLIVQAGDASLGQGAGAYAELSALGSQSFGSVAGEITVAGGTASGNHALVSSASTQTLGTTTGSGGAVTNAVSVLGGSGDTAYARLTAGGTQTILAGQDRSDTNASGHIIVAGGSGQDATAEIATTGAQTIGAQSTACSFTCNDPTQDVRIEGGTGTDAFASVRAGTGGQTVLGGNDIRVVGGSGGGAYAELVSAGAQNVGLSATTNNDPTASILVQAGSGGVALMRAAGTQTVHTGGTLAVLGGTAANMTAALESTGGFQTIGNASPFSNDPTDDVTVQGGNASGAAAWIRAATGQSLNTSGVITVSGGAAGAYAEIVTNAGTQTVGNLSTTPTSGIVLTGGSAAGAHAKLGSGGSQNVSSAGTITLTGGTDSGSGAMLLATTGQQVTTQGNLAVTGGSNTGTGLDASGLRNQTSGNQTVNVSGNLTQTGGSGAADTWIYQSGTGSQTLTVGGDLTLVSPHASGAVNSIEAFGSAQTLNVGGGVTLDNQNNWITYIASHNGTQNLTADTLAIHLAGSQGGAFAGVATGTGQNQFITLQGDGVTAGSATVTLTNTNATANSRAAINSGGNLSLRVSDNNYDTAGAVSVGSSAGLGQADISAAADMNLVAGSLTLQGGASSAATAEVNAPGTLNISTLYGPVQLLGGAAGAASIDPALLSVVSNGSVLMQAGPGSTANTSITAGTFNLAATSGNLALNNSSLATSTINADIFNFTGPGAVTLNGGTITVTTSGNIDIAGLCTNCSTNLFGPFSVSAFTPPPMDFGALVAGDIITLTDASGALFELVLGEDGSVTVNRRRINQCY